MRISDWSSDVCSSDLPRRPASSRRSCALLQGNGGVALFEQFRRRIAVQVIEHRLDRLHRQFEVGVDLDVDQAAAFLDPGLFLRLVPELLRGQVLAPAQHRFRSEEHTSELQSLMRISYAVSCLRKKTPKQT